MLRQRQVRTFAKVYKNYVNGQWKASVGAIIHEVTNPATGELVAQCPQSTTEEFNEIVAASAAKQKEWADVPISTKVRYMLKYQELIKQNQEKIAAMIVLEHGKSTVDANGDIFRGFEVVEHACSFSSLVQGETVENVARNVDIYSYRTPLGVCAGICPFNFPAMIPLWMFPLSITLGNTYVLKPSEKVAGTAEILIDLLKEAGVPDGVVNVVQGGKQTVTEICTHEDIRAVSFVGGNQAGEYIYKTASSYGKRAQVNMGAKNHAIVMPDADKEDTINALVGACFGSTGQRCMAITTTVFVGESADWIPEIVERTKSLSVGPGWENADVTPMNNAAALERAERLIAPENNIGAKMLLDGRKPKVEGYPNGLWIAPTIYDNAEPGNAIYDEELFAPVFVAVRRNTLSEAIDFVNANEYGNGAAIFTRSGGNARKFQHECEAGQLGINLPIPVPLPMFSFTGNKKSMWGTANFYGKGAVTFNTQWKTVTARWKEDSEEAQKLTTAMPTMK